jgi:predicted nucleic acid-binding protein
VSICLDSWAVLAWLKGVEPAAGRVDDALADRPSMSWINVGEVLYVLQRTAGQPEAHRVLRELRRHLVLQLPTEDTVVAAATIKASNRLAYADAFAIATAQANQAILYTGDPEIINGDPEWPVEDLR